MNWDSSLFQPNQLIAPDQIPGFNLEEYKQGLKYKQNDEYVNFYKSDQYKQDQDNARQYNMRNDQILNSMDIQGSIKTPEQKQNAAFENCKDNDQTKIPHCVRYCYLSLCAGQEGVKIQDLHLYKNTDEDTTAIDAVINRINQYKLAIDNGIILPKPGPRSRSRSRFKRKSKNRSKRKSKKRSKRKSKMVSQNRSKKRSKRKSKKLSAKRSK